MLASAWLMGGRAQHHHTPKPTSSASMSTPTAAPTLMSMMLLVGSARPLPDEDGALGWVEPAWATMQPCCHSCAGTTSACMRACMATCGALYGHDDVAQLSVPCHTMHGGG